jgi:thioesterase domain-containing protein
MDALRQSELLELENEEVRQSFQITDANSLNWAFRKMAALNSQKKEIEQLAQSERERIDQWETEQLKPVNNSLEHFETLINIYHAQLLQQDPKAKTLSTPYGKSKSRVSKEAPEKVDEKQILIHVEESRLDEFIEPKLKWGEYKKTLQIVEVNGEKHVVNEHGQVVPGVSIKPGTVTYKVEVD